MKTSIKVFILGLMILIPIIAFIQYKNNSDYEKEQVKIELQKEQVRKQATLDSLDFINKMLIYHNGFVAGGITMLHLKDKTPDQIEKLFYAQYRKDSIATAKLILRK